MNVTIGRMNKRPNSTKRTMDSSFNTSVKLKEPTSLKAPVFILTLMESLSDPATFNYNYVIWQNRYYYIDDVVYIDYRLMEIHCSMDLLATYKPNIVGSRAILQYCSNPDRWIPEVDDYRFTPRMIGDDHVGFTAASSSDNPTKVTASVVDLNDTAAAMFDFDTGVFVVNCIGNGDIAGAGAGPHWWVLTRGQFAEFYNKLYEFDLLHGAMDKLGAVRCILWLPFKMSMYSSLRTATMEIDGKELVLNARYHTVDGVFMGHSRPSIGLPKDPGAGFTYPKFMLNNRWCSMQLNIPGGVTDLNTDYLLAAGGARLDISIDADLFSGDTQFSCYMYTAEDHTIGVAAHRLIYETHVNYGLDVTYMIDRIRNVSDDITNFIKNTASISATAAAAFAGGPLAGVATARVTAAKNGLAQLEKAGVSNGSVYDSAKQALVAANAYRDNVQNISEAGNAINFAANSAQTMFTHQVSCSEMSFARPSSIPSVFSENSRYIIINVKYYKNETLYSDSDIEVPNEARRKNALQKYQAFCNEYGYPAGEKLDWIRADGLTTYYVCQDVQISTRQLGMTDAEAIAVANVCKSGIWIE